MRTWLEDLPITPLKTLLNIKSNVDVIVQEGKQECMDVFLFQQKTIHDELTNRTKGVPTNSEGEE